MKTFAASAVIAASASAFDVVAVPDFVAGFIYRMTGDNHLTEVEACFPGGELMYHEIEAGIADIKKGGQPLVSKRFRLGYSQMHLAALYATVCSDPCCCA